MTKICSFCKTEFPVKPSHFTRRSYCSKNCMAGGYKLRMRGSMNPNFGFFRRVKARNCLICGKPFKTYQTIQSAKTCSKECKSRRMSVQRLGVPNPQRPGIRVRLGRRCKCVICGVEFRSFGKKKRCPLHTVQASVRKCLICGNRISSNYSKTCSSQCSSRHRANIQRGDLSHRWRGGSTSPSMILRGSFDYAQWRTSVFERDEYTCLVCGCRGGRLAAHHIKPFGEFPSLRLVLANGVTLCWPCHTPIRWKEADFEQWLKVNRPGLVTHDLETVIRAVATRLESRRPNQAEHERTP